MFHILVVDDDKHTRMLLRAILEEAGYTVTTANNGEEALDVLDREHIDLVVLDIMMPKMDGYEFTKTIRETNDALPILMVTAKQDAADEKQGFLVGTDDYITKPIDEEKMLLRIKALLRRAQIVSEQKIVIGDVTLDYNSFTVSRKGETQVLPQKEFLLLYKLLSYPGQIFTRIQLMDEIWGSDSETGWETVTVHVGRLRRRFEGWEEFEIKSVRGLGYKAVKRYEKRRAQKAPCSHCTGLPVCIYHYSRRRIPCRSARVRHDSARHHQNRRRTPGSRHYVPAASDNQHPYWRPVYPADRKDFPASVLSAHQSAQPAGKRRFPHPDSFFTPHIQAFCLPGD